MGNGSGSNGTSALPIVRTLVVEELDTGLVPQTTICPKGTLFGDQRIFVGVPQYHSYIQGAIGVDQEPRQQVIALAE